MKDTRSVSGYILIVILASAIFASTAVMSPTAIKSSFAALPDIAVETDELTYDQGNSVTISGTVNDYDPDQDDSDVFITVYDSTGSKLVNSKSEPLNDDGEFEYSFDLEFDSTEGRDKVVVTHSGDDNGITFFKVQDDEDDRIILDDINEEYDPSDKVTISGTVSDSSISEDQVKAVIYDSAGNSLTTKSVTLESDDSFSTSYTLSSSAAPGVYSIKLTYDGDDVYAVFRVTGDTTGDSSGSTGITLDTDKTTYALGDTVKITGKVSSIVSGKTTVSILVTDPNDDIVFSKKPTITTSTKGFAAQFILADDAVKGKYTVSATYNGKQEEITITIGTSSTSGGSSSLTAKIDKKSYLAGETMTITGTVPKLLTDEQVNIVVLSPSSLFVTSAYVDPDDDRSYSAAIKLKPDLMVTTGYKVKVDYGSNEVITSFDITGVSSGETSSDITVHTDKKEYDAGSTVKITGTIASSLLSDGEQALVQVKNPEGTLYRVDPTTPSSTGSFTYNVVVGGPLGKPGTYEVTVTYKQQQVKTTFVLGGETYYDLKVKENTYKVKYKLGTESTLKNMFVKTTDNKLVISIDAQEDGQLMIVLPRNVIDAIENNSDIKYIVYTTDLEAGSSDEDKSVQESGTTSSERTLLIDYKKGTDVIEIAGTTVVPEFGMISAIVLAIAIVGIIAATSRFAFGAKFSNINGNSTSL